MAFHLVARVNKTYVPWLLLPAPPPAPSTLSPIAPIKWQKKNSGEKMATAGSRTSSSGLLESVECVNVVGGPQGGCSAPGVPSSPGKVKRTAGEGAQWRRKELRKVRSVDLEKAEVLHLSAGSAAAPIAAQLHYLSVSSPASVQHSRHVQHSNSLTEHPLLDKASNILTSGAQELSKSSSRSSGEELSADHHVTPGTSVDVSWTQR